MAEKREIVAHRGSMVNDQLQILADPIPVPGLAPRYYEVHYPATGGGAHAILPIRFPSGPQVQDCQLTNEVLLAIVQDRLQQFQDGQFRSHENGMALAGVTNALNWLRQRTAQRQARGVEGTQVP